MSSNELLQCLVPTRELRISNFLRITAAEETQEEAGWNSFQHIIFFVDSPTKTQR